MTASATFQENDDVTPAWVVEDGSERLAAQARDYTGCGTHTPKSDERVAYLLSACHRWRQVCRTKTRHCTREALANQLSSTLLKHVLRLLLDERVARAASERARSAHESKHVLQQITSTLDMAATTAPPLGTQSDLPTEIPPEGHTRSDGAACAMLGWSLREMLTHKEMLTQKSLDLDQALAREAMLLERVQRLQADIADATWLEKVPGSMAAPGRRHDVGLEAMATVLEHARCQISVLGKLLTAEVGRVKFAQNCVGNPIGILTVHVVVCGSVGGGPCFNAYLTVRINWKSPL